MTTTSLKPADYVREVGARTIAHIKELHDEISALRELAERFEERKSKIKARADELEADLDRQLGESTALIERFRETDERYRKLAADYAAIEEQNTSLSNLYVASYRLHDTMEQGDVVEVIQEVIINLVGSEELGIFELSPDGRSCKLLGSFGLDTKRYRTIPVHGGLIERVVSAGEIVVVRARDLERALPHEQRMTACIPLKLRGLVMGVVAIFGLLPHKRGLTRIDYELFELLSSHAATSLYCGSTNARVGGSVQAPPLMSMRPEDSLPPRSGIEER